MIILDDKHFYKIDGEFLLIVNDVVQAVNENKVFDLMLASARLAEKSKNITNLEEIK